MSKKLAARHMHTARAAMLLVTSLHRTTKCPFLMLRTSKQMNEQTDWKRLNILRISMLCFVSQQISDDAIKGDIARLSTLE